MSNPITVHFLNDLGFKSETTSFGNWLTLEKIEVYVPSEGDRIEVSVKSDHNPDNYETSIPYCKTESDMQDLMRLMGVSNKEKA